MIKEALDVKGWLRPVEVEFICKMVRETKNLAGCVLEIGAFHGRSTIQLADECRTIKKPFVTIDDFSRGRIVDLKTAQDCNNILKNNLKKHGVADYVEIIEADSSKMKWDREISMLFHDGSHICEGVKKDLEIFLPHIVEGGWILLHDYTREHSCGVKKAANEFGLIDVDVPFEETCSIGAFRNDRGRFKKR